MNPVAEAMERLLGLSIPKEMLPGLGRIMAQITFSESGCWTLPPTKGRKGYSVVKFRGKTMAAHRMFYQIAVGPIPDGLVLDHLCMVKNCCNPSHLEPVTSKENTRRAPTHNANKKACKRGHPLEGTNLFVDSGGFRQCRTCVREAGRLNMSKYRQLRRAGQTMELTLADS